MFRSDFFKLDASSQKRLFSLFRQKMYPHVYFILHDHALTEDAIQEAFLKAVRRGPKTRENSNMTAWLKKIARNAAYDIGRKNKKYRQLSDLESVLMNETAVSQDDVQKEVEEDVRNGILYQTIRDLKPDYRIVIYLHYLEGLSYAEIADELGISEQVLAQRLVRARKKLARLFKRKWGE